MTCVKDVKIGRAAAAIVIGCGIAAAEMVGSAQPSRGSPGDWPSQNLDLRNRRYSPLDKINTSTVSNLRLAWTFETDATDNISEVTPLVVGRVMYFHSRSRLFAVDAATGAPKWTATPGGPLRATPAVTDDTLYVGDKTGKLFALDLADGTVRWKKDDVKGQLLTTPLVVGDVVLVTPFEGDNLLAAYTTSGAFKWGFAPSR